MIKPAFTAAALLAFLVGCGAGSGSDSVPAAEASSRKTSVDEGGHPLAAPTDDAGTLWFESELLRLVNAHRVSLGLGALVESGDLADVARAHSRHMIVHRFFSHTSPEGLEPAGRVEGAGLEWSMVGENIGAGYGTPEAVFEAWLASPGHRAVLEYEGWTHAGAGYALDGAPSGDFAHAHFWTQKFLRR